MINSDQPSPKLVVSEMYAPWHPSKSHHLVLNHSNEYKDSITGAHTNTIEGLWMHAKRERNGNSYVTDALIEYMWRRFHATWTSGTTQMSVSMNSLMLCISRVFGDDFAGIQKQHLHIHHLVITRTFPNNLSAAKSVGLSSRSTGCWGCWGCWVEQDLTSYSRTVTLHLIPTDKRSLKVLKIFNKLCNRLPWIFWII